MNKEENNKDEKLFTGKKSSSDYKTLALTSLKNKDISRFQKSSVFVLAVANRFTDPSFD